MELSWHYPSKSATCPIFLATKPQELFQTSTSFFPAEGIQCWGLLPLRQSLTKPFRVWSLSGSPPKKNTALTEAFGYERIQIFNPEGRLRDLVNKIFLPLRMPWCWAKTSCERIPWQFSFVAKLGFRREIWMSATGISPTFEFELGTAFVPRNARDKIPDGPSQDKLHASTEATKTSKWKAGGWLSLLSCYSRAPGVQERLWRNYFVILAAITNATTLPTGFPEIFDLLLKLFHFFLFTPMLLEHFRLLAGMDWHGKPPSPTNSTQNSNLHILSGNLGEPWPKAKTPRSCFGMSPGGLLYAL